MHKSDISFDQISALWPTKLFVLLFKSKVIDSICFLNNFKQKCSLLLIFLYLSIVNVNMVYIAILFLFFLTRLSLFLLQSWQVDIKHFTCLLHIEVFTTIYNGSETMTLKTHISRYTFVISELFLKWLLCNGSTSRSMLLSITQTETQSHRSQTRK